MSLLQAIEMVPWVKVEKKGIKNYASYGSEHF